MRLFREFADPPRDFSVVPFWFLNERLEGDRLQWQLEEMKKQHVHGAVMHARPGLTTEYLSDAWFAAIETILQTASENGMFTWIYDEYPWHSGMAEWRVPKLHSDFHIRSLDRWTTVLSGAATAVTIDVRAELPEHSGAITAVIVTPLEAGRITGPGSDMTSQLKGDHVTLYLPDGAFQLAVYFERFFHNPYGDRFGVFPVTDLMNQKAVEAFTQLTHAEYARRFPEHMGTTIRAAFTDEPPAATLGWSAVFRTAFRQRKGYDLLPYLAYLWEGDSPEAQKVRLDYGDVRSDLYADSYFGQLESCCESLGIASTGHLLLEETLLFHARFMGDYFRSMRRLHSPGIDYIFPGRIPAVVPKMAVSVANLYGRQRVMTETFAWTGWGFTFEHMKWMTDWQLVHGINLFVPHAFFYASAEDEPVPEIPDNLGFRWYDCPPSMFYQQPYWPYYHHYADYTARLSYLMSQGEQVCRVAVYYPIETVEADFRPTSDYFHLHAFEIPGTWMTADYLWDGPSGAQTDAHFRAVCDTLRQANIDFDVVDDDSLATGQVENGGLVVRGRRCYQAVVLPRTIWLSDGCHGVLREFLSQNGKVMATACLPVYSADAGKELAPLDHTQPNLHLWERPAEELVEALRDADAHDVLVSHPHIYGSHRLADGSDIYFLTSQTSRELSGVEVWLRGAGPAWLLDPVTGARWQLAANADAAGLRVVLDFSAYQSWVVVLAPMQGADDSAPQYVRRGDLVPCMQVPGPWHVAFDKGDLHPHRVRDLPPELLRMPLPEPLTVDSLASWDDWGLEGFSGGALYRVDWEWPGGEQEGDVWLDLGDVRMVAEAWLNGSPMGSRIWGPYRFRVTDELQAGSNRLEVRVVNTLANAIAASYGDSADPVKQGAASFPAEALRSGLLGPVQLQIERKPEQTEREDRTRRS